MGSLWPLESSSVSRPTTLQEEGNSKGRGETEAVYGLVSGEANIVARVATRPLTLVNLVNWLTEHFFLILDFHITNTMKCYDNWTSSLSYFYLQRESFKKLLCSEPYNWVILHYWILNSCTVKKGYLAVVYCVLRRQTIIYRLVKHLNKLNYQLHIISRRATAYISKLQMFVNYRR